MAKKWRMRVKGVDNIDTHTWWRLRERDFYGDKISFEERPNTADHLSNQRTTVYDIGDDAIGVCVERDGKYASEAFLPMVILATMMRDAGYTVIAPVPERDDV